MCYHIVTFVEYSCTHRSRTGRHYIDCNTAHCRLSRFHRRDAHRCVELCYDMYVRSNLDVVLIQIHVSRGRMLPDTGLIMESSRESCARCSTNANGNNVR
ncbi:hypothetical protein B0H21DRAFT_716072 [Amylocystis lapponica]|nr:hypothetical protein B0H21DRAFT_716072 [Amylocystis lapponica]